MTLVPLAVVSFCYALVWSFTHVAIPFYVHDVSPHDSAATLRWIGWIVGIPYPLTILTTPAWVRVAERNPRRFLLLAHAAQGVLFVLTGINTDLTVLVIIRAVLGVTGPATVFAFMVASRANETPPQIAAMQSAGTIGQILGPLLGALGAARLGYTGTFVAGGVILLLSVVFIAGTISARPGPWPPAARPPDASRAGIPALGFLVFIEFSLLSFLSAVLPAVMGYLARPPGEALDLAGMMLFVSGAAFAAGTLLASPLATRFGERATVRWCHIAACIVVGMLALAPDVRTFTGLRGLQALFLGPAITLLMARGAQHPNSQAIGALNSARMTANLGGPVLATTLLSYLPVNVMFALFAVLGLGALAMLPRRPPAPPAAPVGAVSST